MNSVSLIGRLTKQPELQKTTSGKSILRFSIAVRRKFKNNNGEFESDFINCLAFEKVAELISQYFNKGSLIGVCGRIQTGSYEKNGTRVYTTDILVSDIDFLESKKDQAPPQDNTLQAYENYQKANSNSVEDPTDEELPF